MALWKFGFVVRKQTLNTQEKKKSLLLRLFKCVRNSAVKRQPSFSKAGPKREQKNNFCWVLLMPLMLIILAF